MESLTGEREPNRGRRPRQITAALAAVGVCLALGTFIGLYRSPNFGQGCGERTQLGG